ncbi:hypothetical protein SmJEL517_g03627 [Synchytrium microbalum]|uniref:Probable quinone oxidoreductase n=1 Tax=Synchytrium microbalum TaxID=1806994 RepID=A0A507BXL8_9FUNG|nr:uncharacterized protein SmJEL517_g03627 [Synchytrium microbalum]TPX33527.1 hypothetical protein SmJEL517_g03627 [Synchytrium microbalum]
MKAIQYLRTGGPEVLAFVDVPIPLLGNGQVLVNNFFAGVNFIDTYHRSGLCKISFLSSRLVLRGSFQPRQARHDFDIFTYEPLAEFLSIFIVSDQVPMPFIPGREGSGVIEKVGEGVTDFKVGDRVVYMSGSSYAEKVVVPAKLVYHLPPNVSFEDGVAAFLQGLTAIMLVKLCHHVEPSQYILIHAAAGGTGRIIASLARDMGAIVIGTTSTKAKAETAKAAGCHHVVLYTETDLVSEVMKITNKRGVSAVFDGVGKSTFDASIACLSRLGSMISFGNASGAVPPVELFKLSPKALRLMRPTLNTFSEDEPLIRSWVDELFTLLSHKKFTVLIHQIYPLANAAQAQIDITGRATEGKLLIACSKVTSRL